MEKPLSVARYEFIHHMAELINNSSLPPFIIESVLKDMYSDICALSQKQLKTDLQNYMKEQENKEGK